ncbi:MAG: phosphate ABC transporter permease subunit PstC [Clostridia bacterium]|nr:phosphate ABC transporter permease subunit PstC [Clostridia bacterium]
MTKVKEKIGRAVFAVSAGICILAVVAIFVFLLAKSAPAFAKIGVFNFVFGDTWLPSSSDSYNAPLSGEYGVFTMIVGTLATTVGALAFGGVLGYFTAVFLVFFCPNGLKKVLSSAIGVLAGIPSVVYGFFGVQFLLPILALFAPNNGAGLLATSLVLGLMILPTVVSLSKTSLESVPRAYYEGAVAMGATHTQAVFKTVVPAARSGIVASLVLGVGRALGETMAVVMIAGNSATYPSGLFGSFRVLTANIVLEMGYAGEVQEGALVATGVVLLVFVLLVNILFSLLSARAVKRAVKKTKNKKSRPRVGMRIRDFFGNLAYRMKSSSIGKGTAIFSGTFTALTLVCIVGFVLIKGLPHVTPHFLFGKFVFGSENITIFTSIVTTLMAIALSLAVAVPLGVMTAIFLHEYTAKENLFVRIVRGAIDILGGVPSIVYGLFGLITFVRLFGGTSSILAGGLTVSVMLLPTIVRSTEESLRAVSDSLREGSYALGAGKLRTVFKIVLPSALGGILSAIVLAMGRVVSESAPFLYTAGSVIWAMPTSYADNGATLAVAMYRLAGEGWHTNEAYATAVVLVGIVLILNLLAGFVAKKLQKKWNGEKR